MTTVRQTLAAHIRHLAAAGIETASLDAGLIIAHVLGCGREALYLDPERSLTADEVTRVTALVVRRAGFEPLAHLTGHREFWSLDFEVTRATLVPRPDTETLIEAALDFIRARDRGTTPLRLLDLGTGSGCILLSLLSELPAATGIGLDISADALDVAGRNAARLGLGDRVQFRRSDWWAGLAPADGRFDLIVSNPPYIPSAEIAALAADVRGFEPLEALDGGVDGLVSYRHLATSAPLWIAAGGALMVEVGVGQGPAVGDLFRAAGLSRQESRSDLAGLERVICAFP